MQSAGSASNADKMIYNFLFRLLKEDKATETGKKLQQPKGRETQLTEERLWPYIKITSVHNKGRANTKR